MKKYLFVFLLAAMASILNAQTIFVESENIAVSGAVSAELMLELKEDVNSNRGLTGNRYLCIQDGRIYRIIIDLNNYNINSEIIYNYLRSNHYWVNNLLMTPIRDGTYINGIQVTYPFNGRNYSVTIRIVFPG